MEVFRQSGHSDFCIKPVQNVKEHRDRQSDKQNDEEGQLERKFLSIVLYILESSQEVLSKENSLDMYLNRVQWLPYKKEQLEEVKELFFMLESQEERIAQLFFYAPPHESNFNDFIDNVQRLQGDRGLGGVLCGFGIFEQQSAYIRSINQITKIPLLLGCRLESSLHVYMASRQVSLLDCKNMIALGENLGEFLKEYGIVFSLALKEITSLDLLSYSQLIIGLEHSQNIQGRMYDGELSFEQIFIKNPIALRYCLANTIKELSSEINFSSLKFIGPSILANDEAVVRALNLGGEYFMFSNFYDYNLGVKKIVKLIQSGKVSPEILNKNILKMLLLKQRMKAFY
ncbi:hypothetical protein [Chlamydia pecorum]|uniref:Uncharacterized protein n=1 Tax=Chlamydia pecorum (strain ATCC VR-628 / DSM 29919 / E58) TaxID=331635 RepID=A0AA34RDK6_CHLPE|nr:hypothetical protein [Chlamydia pecorum]AEB41776.1 conserved hypothetical protein [Chlamydia pecorum E58]AGW39806.1 hypothetical protein CPE3_0464 [Chlamydia pecorum P787]UFP06421.1 hypothetical protein KY091_03015 [Chlamydia pecorum]UJT77133.1 hypothetical protein NSWBovSBE_0738 [Chlamydia pecorum]